MKRIISYVIFTSIIFVLSITNVFAYSYQITSKSIVVGESVTLTIDASDNTGKFDISSSDTSVVTVSNGSGVWIEKEKATFKILQKSEEKLTLLLLQLMFLQMMEKRLKIHKSLLLLLLQNLRVIQQLQNLNQVIII